MTVGQELRLASGTPSIVTAMSTTVVHGGLYHPHTIARDVIVGGIFTRNDTTAVHPTVTEELSAPLLAVWQLDMRSIAVGWLYDASALRPWGVAVLPSRLALCAVYNPLASVRASCGPTRGGQGIVIGGRKESRGDGAWLSGVNPV